MMQCCGTYNTGCCLLHDQNIVSFDNMRKKYSVNEDIHIEYTLLRHIQEASTRDWLGIFPRGWTNLQQYLTFEYALVAPRAAASSNRTIIFPRVFHQEASTRTEYQFVYVSKEIQVLATSSYFRFIREDETDAANRVLQIPYRSRVPSSEKREIHSDQFATLQFAPPHIVLSDQSLLSLRPSRTIPANPRLPRTCRSCGRQRDNVCGLAAGRAHSLATQNAALAERLVRLERDLALAEGTRSGLAERLRAYENFVGEMLRSLATKRVVKITDASGKEIVLQQLPIVADPEVEVIDESMNSSGKIQRSTEMNDPIEKENLSTNDRALVGEYLSEDKTLLLKDDQDDGKTQGEIAGDSVVEEKLSSADVETQTGERIDANYIGEMSETKDQEDSIDAGCNDVHRKRITIAEESETLESSVIDHDEQDEVSAEKKGCNDCKTEKSSAESQEGSKTLQSKPSAIVIQGSNVKFAIIRY